jgi:hypothetical protein
LADWLMEGGGVRLALGVSFCWASIHRIPAHSKSAGPKGLGLYTLPYRYRCRYARYGEVVTLYVPGAISSPIGIQLSANDAIEFL